MKYLSLVVLLLILSCTSIIPPPALMPEKLAVTGIDFTKYTNMGFLFTIDTYSGEYESIGVIELDYMPQANYIKREGEAQTIHTMVIQKKIDLSKAMDKIYDICVAMGADALTQMDFEYYQSLYPETYYNLDGMKLSGFAIKRK